MPYPEQLVAPMRAELTRIGVTELKTAEAVDQELGAGKKGTTLLIVNSVCGCAAANARPAVSMSLQADIRPDRFATVFAGQDLEATARAREFLAGIPPSSPSIALLKDGEPVFVLERRHIEGRSASAIATDLVTAYQRFCAGEGDSGDGAGTAQTGQEPLSDLPPTFKSIL